MLSDPQKSQKLFKYLDLAHDYVKDYISTIDQRDVFPTDESIATLADFDEDLPFNASDAEDMLHQLHKIGSANTVAQISGRYFGFVNGATHPPALAAKWLSDTWDQNSALYVMSPIVSKLENVCEKWLTELLRLPDNTALGLVSGSSMSIFCGLAAARNEILRRKGWDANSQGLFGAPEFKVVLGEQSHASVYKALSLLGLGRDRIETVATDDQGRIIVEQIPELDEQTLVIVQAGNVNSGAFDPLQQICALAKAAGAWVHVDGAFGLWAGACKKTYHLYEGAEFADSWSADAHKTLNAPYDCGIVLCKHRAALVSALQASGTYLQWSSQRDGMLYTPEMSRRARSVELWATLKTLGIEGIDRLVGGLCQRAQQFAIGLQQHGFQIVNEVVFNQVLVRCDNDALTNQTLSHIQKSGECWCGGSVWHDSAVIRISVCSWNTSEVDIERAIRAFVDARASCK